MNSNSRESSNREVQVGFGHVKSVFHQCDPQLNLKKWSLVAMMVLAFTSISLGQKVAIIGVDASGGNGGGDEFSFVALEAIPANTRIYFTDNEYASGMCDYLDVLEFVIYWESSVVVPAGEVISITETATANTFSTACSSGGSVCGMATHVGTSGAFNLSTTQDEIAAYEDTNTNPTDGITTIHSLCYWDFRTGGTFVSATVLPANDPSGDVPCGVNTLILDGLADGMIAGLVGFEFTGNRAAQVTYTDLQDPSKYTNSTVNFTINLTPFSNLSSCVNDTTNIAATTCDPGQVGVTQQTLTNIFGCDSVVITTTTLLPSDTTNIAATTCDPGQVGVTQQTLTNIFGCDSVVITTTTLLPSDTTNIAATTCDPGQVGVTQQTLTNIFGCDSVVITTTTLLPSDTTNIAATTCDPGQVGVTQQTLTNIFGCDSVVITTTTLLPSDTTNIAAVTCDPGQVGVTQQTITNRFGCDSVIITTTTIDPSCLMNFTTHNTLTFRDPCQCGNPLNTQLGDIVLIEDTLIISGSAGLTIRFVAAGSTNFLDQNGNPIADQTLFIENPAGEYKLQFYRPSGTSPVVMISLNGGAAFMIPDTAIPLCICAIPIPTLSQWALMVLSLSIMIFGIVSLRQKTFQLDF